jgi:hypothetical protein
LALIPDGVVFFGGVLAITGLEDGAELMFEALES